MQNNQDKNKLAVIAGIALGTYFLYKISKGTSVKTSVVDTITKPVKIVEDVADQVVKVGKKGLKYFSKGSNEAKNHMKNLRAKRTGKNKSVKSIEAEIKLHEDKALKLFSEGKMKEGKIHEKKADLIYKKNYSTLFPKYKKKLSDSKKKVPSYKKGGVVKKTGLALVHKGEKIIPKNKTGAIVGTSSGGKRVTIVESRHKNIFDDEDKEEQRIQELEAEGMTRSDAQGVYEAENYVSKKKSDWEKVSGRSLGKNDSYWINKDGIFHAMIKESKLHNNWVGQVANIKTRNYLVDIEGTKKEVTTEVKNYMEKN